MRRLAVLLIALAACTAGEEAAPLSPSPTAGTASPTEAPSPTETASPDATAPDLAAVRVRLQRVASLEQPLAMAIRRGDDALYIAEKTGRIVALRDGRETTVLDLSDEVSDGSEQGLLGLAFSPDGEFLYVNFTDRGGDTRIWEYAVRDGRPAPGSRRAVLFVNQPFSNHNGGNLVFGPDGFLYIGLGDGGSGRDPQNNGQSLGTLLGKMLRIDPRPSDGRPYRIPEDNPFVGRAGTRPEIWAYGLRNPWRYSFDRQTGDLWIGDVGQNAFEEIDFRPASSRGGENYGWALREGRHRLKGERPSGAVDPVFEYPLSGGNCAVTGGYVYRGRAIPALRGAYLFADFCVGRITALAREGREIAQQRRLGLTVENLSSFGEDHDGEIYALSLSGDVFRLEPR